MRLKKINERGKTPRRFRSPDGVSTEKQRSSWVVLSEPRSLISACAGKESDHARS
jgi:hypothetical protein